MQIAGNCRKTKEARIRTDGRAGGTSNRIKTPLS